jgi:hypothetical protein
MSYFAPQNIGTGDFAERNTTLHNGTVLGGAKKILSTSRGGAEDHIYGSASERRGQLDKLG